MTDREPEVELTTSEAVAWRRPVAGGCAPCGCRVLVVGPERLAACELADVEGWPRPAGCARKAVACAS